MNETAAYIVTGEVLTIARVLWEIAVGNMTEEEFATLPPLDKFLPEATRLFITRHAEIQRLIAEQTTV